MKIVSYLVRRELNEPTGLVVADALPVQDDSLQIAYTFGRVSEADSFGQSLFLHYTDVSNGADLVDIILPDVSDELMDELLMQESFEIHDTAQDQVLTFQVTCKKEAVL